MKKTYQKPKAKKIDFVYQEQVVAASEVGVEARPYNPTYCQYLSASDICKAVVHHQTICETKLWTLR